MLRLLLGATGLVFVLVGLVLWPLPIPFGLLLVLVGLMMLIPVSPATADAVKALRRRAPALDRWLKQLARRLPAPYRRILRKTEPEPS